MFPSNHWAAIYISTIPYYPTKPMISEQSINTGTTVSWQQNQQENYFLPCNRLMLIQFAFLNTTVQNLPARAFIKEHTSCKNMGSSPTNPCSCKSLFAQHLTHLNTAICPSCQFTEALVVWFLYSMHKI